MSRRVTVRWGGATIALEASFQPGRVSVERDGRVVETGYVRDGRSIALLGAGGAGGGDDESGGVTRRAVVARDARGLWVSCRGRTWLLVPETRGGAARGAADAADEIRAPMTGRVVSVAATAGMTAKEGDLLLTIEAMKMEFKLAAPEDGEVLEVACAAGDRVELGQLLVRLGPASEGTGS